MFAMSFARTGVAVALASFLLTPERASDPVGVYALIDRVVMTPDTVNPTTVQLWGVFALTDGERGGYDYQPAKRGYMYYTIGSENPRAVRAEWADHRTLASLKQVTAYGGRYMPNGRIRSASEAAASPDAYPLNIGIASISMARRSPSGVVAQFRTLNGPAIEAQLHSVPNPQTPAEGARVTPGPVRLVVPAVRDTALRYVFEIEGPNGVKETSQPQNRSGGSASFSPGLSLVQGASYTWRVWTVRPGFTGPAASATFRAGS